MENEKYYTTADPVNDLKKMYEDFKNKPRVDAYYTIPSNLIYEIIDGTAKTINAIESLEKENAALKAELDALKKQHEKAVDFIEYLDRNYSGYLTEDERFEYWRKRGKRK